jgi:hypothetical protein
LTIEPHDGLAQERKNLFCWTTYFQGFLKCHCNRMALASLLACLWLWFCRGLH